MTNHSKGWVYLRKYVKEGKDCRSDYALLVQRPSHELWREKQKQLEYSGRFASDGSRIDVVYEYTLAARSEGLGAGLDAHLRRHRATCQGKQNSRNPYGGYH
eukprot:1335301-Amorphochlora_amoeboformis.AAC.1